MQLNPELLLIHKNTSLKGDSTRKHHVCLNELLVLLTFLSYFSLDFDIPGFHCTARCPARSDETHEIIIFYSYLALVLLLGPLLAYVIKKLLPSRRKWCLAIRIRLDVSSGSNRASSEVGSNRHIRVHHQALLHTSLWIEFTMRFGEITQTRVKLTQL